jgi:uncharacterized membrane protein YdjX (TVP38/TMEM64 family)
LVWAAIIAALIAIAVVGEYSPRTSLANAADRAKQCNGLLLFSGMVVLPICGFSVAIVEVVAGAKFGSGPGLLVISVAIAGHLLGSYWIGNSFLRRLIENRLRKTKYRLPHLHSGQYASVTMLVGLLPGMPYAVKNYLLVLAGVPFRIYFSLLLPIHILRSAVAIFVGGFSGNLTSGKLTFLVGFFLCELAICTYLIHRLLRHGGFKRSDFIRPNRPHGAGTSPR